MVIPVVAICAYIPVFKFQIMIPIRILEDRIKPMKILKYQFNVPVRIIGRLHLPALYLNLRYNEQRDNEGPLYSYSPIYTISPNYSNFATPLLYLQG